MLFSTEFLPFNICIYSHMKTIAYTCKIYKIYICFQDKVSSYLERSFCYIYTTICSIIFKVIHLLGTFVQHYDQETFYIYISNMNIRESMSSRKHRENIEARKSCYICNYIRQTFTQSNFDRIYSFCDRQKHIYISVKQIGAHKAQTMLLLLFRHA